MKGVGYRWDLENKGGRLSFQQIFLLPLISLSFGSIDLPSSYTLMFFSSLPYLNPHSSPVYFYSLSYTLVDRRLLLVYPTATFIFHIMLHSSAPLHLPPFSLLLHTYLPHFIPSISVHYTTRLFSSLFLVLVLSLPAAAAATYLRFFNYSHTFLCIWLHSSRINFISSLDLRLKIYFFTSGVFGTILFHFSSWVH